MQGLALPRPWDACLTAASVLALAACAGGTEPRLQDECVGGTSVASVVPADTSLTVGDRAQLNAMLVCSPTNRSISAEWQWISSNSTIATVDDGGSVTGVAVGTVQLSARPAGHPGVTAVATVRVVPVKQVLSVAIS